MVAQSKISTPQVSATKQSQLSKVPTDTAEAQSEVSNAADNPNQCVHFLNKKHGTAFSSTCSLSPLDQNNSCSPPPPTSSSFSSSEPESEPEAEPVSQILTKKQEALKLFSDTIHPTHLEHLKNRTMDLNNPLNKGWVKYLEQPYVKEYANKMVSRGSQTDFRDPLLLAGKEVHIWSSFCGTRICHIAGYQYSPLINLEMWENTKAHPFCTCGIDCAHQEPIRINPIGSGFVVGYSNAEPELVDVNILTDERRYWKEGDEGAQYESELSAVEDTKKPPTKKERSPPEGKKREYKKRGKGLGLKLTMLFRRPVSNIKPTSNQILNPAAEIQVRRSSPDIQPPAPTESQLRPDSLLEKFPRPPAFSIKSTPLERGNSKFVGHATASSLSPLLSPDVGTTSVRVKEVGRRRQTWIPDSSPPHDTMAVNSVAGGDEDPTPPPSGRVMNECSTDEIPLTLRNEFQPPSPSPTPPSSPTGNGLFNSSPDIFDEDSMTEAQRVLLPPTPSLLSEREPESEHQLEVITIKDESQDEHPSSGDEIQLVVEEAAQRAAHLTAERVLMELALVAARLKMQELEEAVKERATAFSEDLESESSEETYDRTTDISRSREVPIIVKASHNTGNKLKAAKTEDESSEGEIDDLPKELEISTILQKSNEAEAQTTHPNAEFDIASSGESSESDSEKDVFNRRQTMRKIAESLSTREQAIQTDGKSETVSLDESSDADYGVSNKPRNKTQKFVKSSKSMGRSIQARETGSIGDSSDTDSNSDSDSDSDSDDSSSKPSKIPTRLMGKGKEVDDEELDETAWIDEHDDKSKEVQPQEKQRREQAEKDKQASVLAVEEQARQLVAKITRATEKRQIEKERRKIRERARKARRKAMSIEREVAAGAKRQADKAKRIAAKKEVRARRRAKNVRRAHNRQQKKAAQSQNERKNLEAADGKWFSKESPTGHGQSSGSGKNGGPSTTWKPRPEQNPQTFCGRYDCQDEQCWHDARNPPPTPAAYKSTSRTSGSCPLSRNLARSSPSRRTGIPEMARGPPAYSRNATSIASTSRLQSHLRSSVSSPWSGTRIRFDSPPSTAPRPALQFVSSTSSSLAPIEALSGTMSSSRDDVTKMSIPVMSAQTSNSATNSKKRKLSEASSTVQENTGNGSNPSAAPNSQQPVAKKRRRNRSRKTKAKWNRSGQESKNPPQLQAQSEDGTDGDDESSDGERKHDKKAAGKRKGKEPATALKSQTNTAKEGENWKLDNKKGNKSKANVSSASVSNFQKPKLELGIKTVSANPINGQPSQVTNHLPSNNIMSVPDTNGEGKRKKKRKKSKSMDAGSSNVPPLKRPNTYTSAEPPKTEAPVEQTGLKKKSRNGKDKAAGEQKKEEEPKENEFKGLEEPLVKPGPSGTQQLSRPSTNDSGKSEKVDKKKRKKEKKAASRGDTNVVKTVETGAIKVVETSRTERKEEKTELDIPTASQESKSAGKKKKKKKNHKPEETRPPTPPPAPLVEMSSDSSDSSSSDDEAPKPMQKPQKGKATCRPAAPVMSLDSDSDDDSQDDAPKSKEKAPAKQTKTAEGSRKGETLKGGKVNAQTSKKKGKALAPIEDPIIVNGDSDDSEDESSKAKATKASKPKARKEKTKAHKQPPPPPPNAVAESPLESSENSDSHSDDSTKTVIQKRLRTHKVLEDSIVVDSSWSSSSDESDVGDPKPAAKPAKVPKSEGKKEKSKKSAKKAACAPSEDKVVVSSDSDSDAPSSKDKIGSSKPSSSPKTVKASETLRKSTKKGKEKVKGEEKQKNDNPGEKKSTQEEPKRTPILPPSYESMRQLLYPSRSITGNGANTVTPKPFPQRESTIPTQAPPTKKAKSKEKGKTKATPPAVLAESAPEKDAVQETEASTTPENPKTSTQTLLKAKRKSKPKPKALEVSYEAPPEKDAAQEPEAFTQLVPKLKSKSRLDSTTKSPEAPAESDTAPPKTSSQAIPPPKAKSKSCSVQPLEAPLESSSATFEAPAPPPKPKYKSPEASPEPTPTPSTSTTSPLPISQLPLKKKPISKITDFLISKPKSSQSPEYEASTRPIPQPKSGKLKLSAPEGMEPRPQNRVSKKPPPIIIMEEEEREAEAAEQANIEAAGLEKMKENPLNKPAQLPVHGEATMFTEPAAKSFNNLKARSKSKSSEAPVPSKAPETSVEPEAPNAPPLKAAPKRLKSCLKKTTFKSSKWDYREPLPAPSPTTVPADTPSPPSGSTEPSDAELSEAVSKSPPKPPTESLDEEEEYADAKETTPTASDVEEAPVRRPLVRMKLAPSKRRLTMPNHVPLAVARARKAEVAAETTAKSVADSTTTKPKTSPETSYIITEVTSESESESSSSESEPEEEKATLPSTATPPVVESMDSSNESFTTTKSKASSTPEPQPTPSKSTTIVDIASDSDSFSSESESDSESSGSDPSDSEESDLDLPDVDPNLQPKLELESTDEDKDEDEDEEVEVHTSSRHRTRAPVILDSSDSSSGDEDKEDDTTTPKVAKQLPPAEDSEESGESDIEISDADAADDLIDDEAEETSASEGEEGEGEGEEEKEEGEHVSESESEPESNSDAETTPKAKAKEANPSQSTPSHQISNGPSWCKILHPRSSVTPISPLSGIASYETSPFKYKVIRRGLSLDSEGPSSQLNALPLTTPSAPEEGMTVREGQGDGDEEESDSSEPIEYIEPELAQAHTLVHTPPSPSLEAEDSESQSEDEEALEVPPDDYGVASEEPVDLEQVFEAEGSQADKSVGSEDEGEQDVQLDDYDVVEEESTLNPKKDSDKFSSDMFGAVKKLMGIAGATVVEVDRGSRNGEDCYIVEESATLPETAVSRRTELSIRDSSLFTPLKASTPPHSEYEHEPASSAWRHQRNSPSYCIPKLQPRSSGTYPKPRGDPVIIPDNPNAIFAIQRAEGYTRRTMSRPKSPSVIGIGEKMSSMDVVLSGNCRSKTKSKRKSKNPFAVVEGTVEQEEDPPPIPETGQLEKLEVVIEELPTKSSPGSSLEPASKSSTAPTSPVLPPTEADHILSLSEIMRTSASCSPSPPLADPLENFFTDLASSTISPQKLQTRLRKVSFSPHLDVSPHPGRPLPRSSSSTSSIGSQVSAPTPAKVLKSILSPVTRLRKPRRKKSPDVSPYFTASSTPVEGKVEGKKKSRKLPAGVAANAWPSVESERFGLIQEELAENDFHLLLSTTFLNRTRGHYARPFLTKFLTFYPTPAILAAVPISELTTFLQPLGLQNTRAKTLHNMATSWVEKGEPRVGRKGRVRPYPLAETKTFPVVSVNEMMGDRVGEDRDGEGEGWEVGHIKGVGGYALDSWRLFCRDRLLADNPDSDSVEKDEEATEGGKGRIREQGKHGEWRTVVPNDKELRGYVRWLWWKHDGVFWGEEWDDEVDMTKASVPNNVPVGKMIWREADGSIRREGEAVESKGENNMEEAQEKVKDVEIKE